MIAGAAEVRIWGCVFATCLWLLSGCLQGGEDGTPNEGHPDVSLDAASDSHGDIGDVWQDAPREFAPCSDEFDAYFSEAGRLHPSRDSNAYMPPGVERREAIATSIQVALEGEVASAQKEAALGEYQICRGVSEGVLVWHPEEPSNGGATLGVRPGSDAAPLVVEAPHPYFEFDTMEQARRIFVETEARAILVSGTHRCSNEGISTCDGRTSVCGESEAPYRESDMAHVTDSNFQVMHRQVTDHYSQSTAVSLHGFSDDGISLSDGTTRPAAQSSPVAQLGAHLESGFPDARVTFCNEIPGRSRDLRLCGTTNVQGRVLNGVDDACIDSAEEGSGRFIHLEQSRAIRRQSAKVAKAFSNWVKR